VPPRATQPDEIKLGELVSQQGGAVSWRQLLAIGMTLGQIEARLVAGVWCHSGLPGVYVAFTGPVGFLSRCWAALLHAGPGCVLCLETAAWVWGLRDDTPPTVDVMIPTTRRVVAQPGMRVHLRVAVGRRRHPARQPPVTSVEETVIDLVDVSQTGADAIDVVIRACQRRLTTAARLLATAELRKKMRRRTLLLDVLSDVVEGVLSALERRWLRDVERAHGLPRGSRNRPEGRSGRRRYRDVHYREYRLIASWTGQRLTRRKPANATSSATTRCSRTASGRSATGGARWPTWPVSRPVRPHGCCGLAAGWARRVGAVRPVA
jgi:hypothetical protein